MNIDDLPPEAIATLLRSMMGRDGSGALQREVGAYDAMGPEGFKQHSNMGTLDERGALAAQESQAQQAMVAQQLGQMQKYMEPSGRQYGSTGAAVVGGIGDIVRQVGGGLMSGKLMGQQKELMAQGNAAQKAVLDQKDAGRLASGNAQMEAARKFMEKLQQQERLRSMTPSMGGPGLSFGMPQLQYDPNAF